MLGLARFVTHSSGGSGPSLNFNFADNSPYLSQQITFTRASAGTFTGSNGLIQNAPVNLLTRSEEFDNAAWGKTRSSVSSNVIAAPDGSVSADKLVEDTATGEHFISRNATVANSTAHTYTIYLKSDGVRNWAGILFTGATATAYTFFDLANGALGTVAANATASITAAGNGWYRCSVTVTTNSTTLAAFLSIATSGSTTSYTGDGTSGIFIWGAQLVEGSVAGPYARTVASTSGAPRFDYDPVTLAAKGLLIEEQRTNLLTYSEDISNAAWTKGSGGAGSVPVVTADTSVSPDGTSNADLVVFNAGPNGASDFSLLQGASFTATAQPYTFSVWLKTSDASTKTVQLNISGAGASTVTVTGVWQRFSTTWTATAGTWNARIVVGLGVTSATASLNVWGAQLEAGAFATSYIPTVASQVTRSADVASVNTLSPWYNATEGTLFAEASGTQPLNVPTGASVAITALSDGSSSNRIDLRFQTGGFSFISFVTSGGVGVATINNSGTYAANTIYKAAIVYRLDDFARVNNGGTVATDTSGAVPVGVNQLRIGTTDGGVAWINGHIRRITYYPRRLPNATLQQITS